jgi:hypothetical protein
MKNLKRLFEISKEYNKNVEKFSNLSDEDFSKNLSEISHMLEMNEKNLYEIGNLKSSLKKAGVIIENYDLDSVQKKIERIEKRLERLDEELGYYAKYEKGKSAYSFMHN